MSALGRTFFTRNLHKKADIATAWRGHPASATTNFRFPISLLFYLKKLLNLYENFQLGSDLTLILLIQISHVLLSHDKYGRIKWRTRHSKTIPHIM